MRQRSVSLAAAVLGIVVFTSASPLRGGVMPSTNTQESNVWSFLKPGQTIRRCTPLSPAHSQAKASLIRFSDRMLRLSDHDAVGPVIVALHDLLKSECFWMASDAGRVPEPD
jgi:hypothetical protein